MDNNFGKGAVKDVIDVRDFQFSDIALALPPFDWEKGYDVEKEFGIKIKVKNQDGSGSCGGQAWGYLGQVLDPDHEEKSAKFIYAHTFVLPAGSAGRTNCDLVIKKGWGSEVLTPSYDNGNPPGEDFMQEIGDITKEAYEHAKTDKALSYANVNIDVELIAQAIKQNRGCIVGITGKNNGTWRTEFPTPPDKIDAECWYHWVYVGKVKLINGRKYFGFINSWGEEVGDKGWQWVSEEYFRTPFIFSVWTLVYNFTFPLLQYGSSGKYVLVLQKKLGIGADGKFGIKTMRAVKEFQKKNNLKADGMVGPKTWNKLNYE